MSEFTTTASERSLDRYAAIYTFWIVATAAVCLLFRLLLFLSVVLCTFLRLQLRFPSIWWVRVRKRDVAFPIAFLHIHIPVPVGGRAALYRLVKSQIYVHVYVGANPIDFLKLHTHVCMYYKWIVKRRKNGKRIRKITLERLKHFARRVYK